MSVFSTDVAFKDGTWYHEKLEEGLVYSYKVNKIEYTGETPFQKIEILDTVPFGRMLISDGLPQSAECDEYAYHECLVHPALLAHPNPKRVFIGGGGEGATLRECLLYSSVTEVIMDDIDEVMIKMCKAHLPNHSAEAYSDPRGKLTIGDAKEYLEKAEDNSIDVMILDFCDPVDSGPCYQLYTVEFYTMCMKKLTENGVLVTQSGIASIREVIADSPTGVFSPVYNTLKQVFPKVFGYSTFIASFCSEWGWNIALKNPNAPDLDKVTDIDEKIKKNGLESKFRYYDQETHTRMFSLPKPVRVVLEGEKRVIDNENPLYMTDSNTGMKK
jgi:thermospermine synthase